MAIASVRKAPKTRRHRKTMNSNDPLPPRHVNRHLRLRHKMDTCLQQKGFLPHPLWNRRQHTYDLIAVSGDELDTTNEIPPPRGIRLFTDDNDKRYTRETLRSHQITVSDLSLPPPQHNSENMNVISGNVLQNVEVNLEPPLESSNQSTLPVECPHCQSKFF